MRVSVIKLEREREGGGMEGVIKEEEWEWAKLR